MGMIALPPERGSIWVLTGGRGAGKTTQCQRWLAQGRAAGWSLAGVLSPGRFAGGQKTGCYVENARSGETRLLSSRVSGELSGLELGSWTFDLEALEWGNHCLRSAGPADLVFIDEIGPLEFHRRQGWTASFDLLARRDFGLAVVVVRPECIADFTAWGFPFETREVETNKA